MDISTFQARGISVSIDLSVGHLADLAIDAEGRVLRPLHRAPWISEPEGTTEDLPAGVKRLSGDFLCAPFSTSDIEAAPLHGWPANSTWETLSSEPTADGWRARFLLQRRVMGASVEKILTLRDGHPFLYQEHVLSCGSGELPVAHHTMTAMKNGGRLAFSAKRFALTPGEAPERDPARGRSMLAYPGRSETLEKFPAASGGFTDLTEYPAGARNEDFVTLVEADHAGPGWTAIARQAEADLVLVLKNPDELPVTMLWISNGGRDYAPWNGRHVGVIGIEDGRSAIGHAASIGDNPLRRDGVATSFELGAEKRVSFRQVIGALPLARPSVPPRRIDAGIAGLRIVFPDGAVRDIPFDAGFLRTQAGPQS
jgi:hypothetical protein